MSKPSTAQQVRDQSGGMGAIVAKSIPLWILIFAGATLTWWQIHSLLTEIGAVLQGGAIEMQGDLSWALGFATLGVVIAVSFSVVAILATGWATAILCLVLIMAPMAIFNLWQPLWMWWVLGPFVGLLFLVLISVRSKMAAKMRFSAVTQAAATTFWVMVLISFFAPMIATHALQITPDRLRPESFEPVAEWMIERLPSEIVAAAISELPQTPAPEYVPAPPPAENPELPVAASPEATPEEALMTPSVATPPAQPANPWGAASPAPVPEANTYVAVPATREAREPKANRAKQAAPALQPTQEQIDEVLSDPETPHRLALGLWHAISAQGEGYAGLHSQAPLVGGFLLSLALIPFTLLSPLVSLILMAPVIWILRRANFVRRLTVTVEVPRYTLRGPKENSKEGPEL